MSPRAWGCTDGMEPILRKPLLQCPHVRGGVPYFGNKADWVRRMSPRAWGCTGKGSHIRIGSSNVPTCVGVYHLLLSQKILQTECPHVRGGVPWSHEEIANEIQMSPRAWGCTGYMSGSTPKTKECPHGRGGVPGSFDNQKPFQLRSPRAWGCTALEAVTLIACQNVPTCVGVYRWMNY